MALWYLRALFICKLDSHIRLHVRDRQWHCRLRRAHLLLLAFGLIHIVQQWQKLQSRCQCNHPAANRSHCHCCPRHSWLVHQSNVQNSTTPLWVKKLSLVLQLRVVLMIILFQVIRSNWHKMFIGSHPAETPTCAIVISFFAPSFAKLECYFLELSVLTTAASQFFFLYNVLTFSFNSNFAWRPRYVSLTCGIAGRDERS